MRVRERFMAAVPEGWRCGWTWACAVGFGWVGGCCVFGGEVVERFDDAVLCDVEWRGVGVGVGEQFEESLNFAGVTLPEVR